MPSRSDAAPITSTRCSGRLNRAGPRLVFMLITGSRLIRPPSDAASPPVIVVSPGAMPSMRPTSTLPLLTAMAWDKVWFVTQRP